MDRVDLEQWKGREVARLLALVETERRYYQEIVASLPVGLAVVARDGSLESANRAFRQIFGLKPEDVYRRTLDQLIPSAELQQAVRKPPVRTQNKPMMLEAAGRNLRVSVFGVRDWDDDTDLEVLLVVEDITGISNRDALRDVPAMIWTATQALEFTVVAGENSGIAHPGFASTQIHPDDRDRVLGFYRWALEHPGPHACEYRAHTAAGKLVSYRDSFTVNPMEEGKAARAAGVVTDVTSRRNAGQISEYSARLDALAGLSRTLSHDLNNSLMVVTGYGEDLLAGMPANEARRNDVEEILGAARRMSALTAHLLTFTRRQAAESEPLNLAEVVARVVGSDNLETRVPPQLQVMASSAQLEDALRAILHRLRSEGRVSLQAHAAEISELGAGGLPQGRYIEIVLVASDSRPLHFDTLLAAKESDGPDLARAYALVREWGGGIWQAGGEVHLLLPAAADVEPAQAEPFSPPEVPEEPEPEPVPIPVVEAPVEPPQPKAETILIVEDEPGIRALVRKILRRQNYEVFEAGSPAEAVQLVEAQGHIDLLITDMALPERSGRQLADDLKVKLPQLRVLYVSGYTDDPSVYDRELPPGAAFLQKPFTLGSLLSKVREVLDVAV